MKGNKNQATLSATVPYCKIVSEITADHINNNIRLIIIVLKTKNKEKIVIINSISVIVDELMIISVIQVMFHS